MRLRQDEEEGRPLVLLHETWPGAAGREAELRDADKQRRKKNCMPDPDTLALRKFSLEKAIALFSEWEFDEADDLKDGLTSLSEAIYNFLTKR